MRTNLLLGLLITLDPPKLNLNASSSESVSIRVNLWLGLLPFTGKRLKFIGSESLALSNAEWVRPYLISATFSVPADGTIIASLIPCRNFLSAGTIVASAPRSFT